MNNSINYSSFVDIYATSNEEFDPYANTDINECLERIFKNIEIYKAGCFNDREYVHDDK